MKTDKLIGFFLKGVLKNSSKFFGKCIEVDDSCLILAGPPGTTSKKIVLISEIASMDVTTWREGE